MFKTRILYVFSRITALKLFHHSLIYSITALKVFILIVIFKSLVLLSHFSKSTTIMMTPGGGRGLVTRDGVKLGARDMRRPNKTR